MSYPPPGGYPNDQGGYPDQNNPYGAPQDPYGWQDPGGQQGYPGQGQGGYPVPQSSPPTSGPPDAFGSGYGQQPGFGQQPGYGQPPGQPPGFDPSGFGQPQPPQKKSNTGLFVGLGLGVLAIVGIVVTLIVVLGGSGGNDSDTADPDTSASADGDDGTDTDDGEDGEDATANTPTEVVELYYRGLENEDIDMVLESMVQSESDLYYADPMSEEELEDQFWSVARDRTYTVGQETIISDSQAEVEISIDYFGSTSDLTAHLVTEDGEWKIQRFA